MKIILFLAVLITTSAIAFLSYYERMGLEDTFHFYQTSQARIAEIDKKLDQFNLHAKIYTGEQTAPLKQERVFICSKLFHAVSFYNLAPQQLKLDKKLPLTLRTDFCFRG